MSGQRPPQNMERAFRMSVEEQPKRPRPSDRPARAAHGGRAVMPENDYAAPKTKQQARKPRKPFRLLRFITTIVVLGWFFVMGVLVGRGTAPVSFEIDNLRSQLVTASAVISERIAQIGGNDETVDFYKSLGQTDTDINISDPRSYRPDYSVAPLGDNENETPETPVSDAAEGGEPVLGTPDELHIDDYEGKILAPLVKPKTEFDGYVALKQAGNQVAQVAQPQPPPPTTVRETPQAATPQPAVNANVNGGVPKGSFSVQVAAVRGENEARAFLQSLAQKGFSGRVEKTTVGSDIWYRVRVGVYQTRAQAEDELQKLIKIGIKSPMIVTN